MEVTNFADDAPKKHKHRSTWPTCIPGGRGKIADLVGASTTTLAGSCMEAILVVVETIRVVVGLQVVSVIYTTLPASAVRAFCVVGIVNHRKVALGCKLKLKTSSTTDLYIENGNSTSV